jgi:hypothetical protein
MRIPLVTVLIIVWMPFLGLAASATLASTPPIFLPDIHLFFRDVEGIIEFPDSTVKTTFRVPVRLFGKSLIYTSIQDGFRYRNARGKLRFLDPKRVKKVSFTYCNQDVELVSQKIPGKGHLFLSKVESGRVNLYHYIIVSHSRDVNGFRRSEEHPIYLIQRDGGSLERVREWRFRRQMREYFADCPALVEKLNNKTYNRYHLHRIVAHCNNMCE